MTDVSETLLAVKQKWKERQQNHHLKPFAADYDLLRLQLALQRMHAEHGEVTAGKGRHFGDRKGLSCGQLAHAANDGVGCIGFSLDEYYRGALAYVPSAEMHGTRNLPRLLLFVSFSVKKAGSLRHTQLGSDIAKASDLLPVRIELRGIG